MSDLDPIVIEQIAARVVELLRQNGATRTELIDASEAARRLGVSRATVYAKAGELGAIRIGDGPRARLRFDPAALAERVEGTRRRRQRPGPTTPTRRKRRVAARRADLLPIRGERPQ